MAMAVDSFTANDNIMKYKASYPHIVLKGIFNKQHILVIIRFSVIIPAPSLSSQ